VPFVHHDTQIGIRARRLPHWEATGATYFVTFRVADSLPRDVLQQIEFQLEDIPATAAQMQRALTGDERSRLARLHSRTLEKYLDAGAGRCWLSNAVIAEAVADSLRKFDGTRYRLFAWCVMPNHVHVVFQTLAGNALSGIIHSWKSFTAKKANQVLKRSGTFWQHEYYDRLIRDRGEFARAVAYVAENPQKAGLNEWKWVWIDK
jgi:REP element-mobilizing transposase RayT